MACSSSAARRQIHARFHCGRLTPKKGYGPGWFLDLKNDREYLARGPHSVIEFTRGDDGVLRSYAQVYCGKRIGTSSNWK